MSMAGSIMALFIFTIMITTIARIFSVYSRYCEGERKRLKVTYVMEYIRNDIMCNWTYDEVYSLLKDRTCYIDMQEDIELETNLQDKLTIEPVKDNNYCVIKGDKHKEKDVMKIEIIYTDGKETTKTWFYKGDYERF